MGVDRYIATCYIDPTVIRQDAVMWIGKQCRARFLGVTRTAHLGGLSGSFDPSAVVVRASNCKSGKSIVKQRGLCLMGTSRVV